LPQPNNFQNVIPFVKNKGICKIAIEMNAKGIKYFG